ncbi:hypothetical protein [Pseudomonas sp. LD120]|uniref:hypothetical protein n=1 Tax=Pseudomonas sp. LD120 TaxID=485751 RepID=UPI0013595729|nr:hypothetical protein [Pseudomonas sp. LD120]KAF0867436.1 hypothetical protein PLD_02925 [Pseudomonas sp. LD120]
MKRMLLPALLLPLCTHALAFGEIGQWSSGWGQGVSEYQATSARGATLYIACSEDRAVSMTLTVGGVDYGTYGQKGFSLIIDGQEISSPYETASRVGQNNFGYAWERLRKASKLLAKTDDGQVVELPTKGSAKTLPALGSPTNSCMTEWDLT